MNSCRSNRPHTVCHSCLDSHQIRSRRCWITRDFTQYPAQVVALPSFFRYLAPSLQSDFSLRFTFSPLHRSRGCFGFFLRVFRLHTSAIPFHQHLPNLFGRCPTFRQVLTAGWLGPRGPPKRPPLLPGEAARITWYGEVDKPFVLFGAFSTGNAGLRDCFPLEMEENISKNNIRTSVLEVLLVVQISSSPFPWFYLPFGVQINPSLEV